MDRSSNRTCQVSGRCEGAQRMNASDFDLRLAELKISSFAVFEDLVPSDSQRWHRDCPLITPGVGIPQMLHIAIKFLWSIHSNRTSERAIWLFQCRIRLMAHSRRLGATTTRDLLARSWPCARSCREPRPSSTPYACRRCADRAR